MRSTLEELTKELQELRSLVASIAPVNSVLEGHGDSLVRKYVTVRRRFDYAAFAVALYASFEKFIENLIAAYSGITARRVKYVDLPQKLVTKHLFRSAELLSRGRLGEGRYAGLREVDVAKNLFECLNGVTPYTLNEAAVIAHDANLRIGEIEILFAAVGIENVRDRLRRADDLLAWFCKSKNLEVPPTDGLPAATLEERLGDIVERRNQVAHRGGTPQDLLGIEEMKDAIDFIEALSRSSYAMVIGQYLTDHHVKTNLGIQLQQRANDGPYKNGLVVIVDKPASRLFVGQALFILIHPSGARWGRIQSIQVDGTNVDAIELDAVAANGIGIAIDFKCPKGFVLTALPSDDELVWKQPDFEVDEQDEAEPQAEAGLVDP